MAKVTTKPAAGKTAEQAESKGEVAVFQAPRLPYHEAVEQKFGVDKGQWNVLVGAIFPAAKTVDSIVMALAYCKHRNLDVFKRPVHIVPMWNSEKGETVETVWPGISELRTTASRTGQYAGCDEAEWGEFVETKFSGRAKQWDNESRRMEWKDIEATVSYPEWCRLTVWRIIAGQPRKFVGPKVLWVESCATIGNTDVPNKMWQERPEGQLEKCAEAAALRRAFPEEIGNELTAEEMTGRAIQDVRTEVVPIAADSAAKDNGPPRQVAQEVLPPETKNPEPPKPTAKPAPERLPDADAETGEDDENPEPREADERDDDGADERREAAGMMDDDAPKTVEKVAPHQIPGKDHTYASWATLYISHINACTSAPEVYKWIDANVMPVNKLTSGSSAELARVRKAIEAKLNTFRGLPDEKPAGKTAAPKADSAPPRTTKTKSTAKPDGATDLPPKPEGHDPEEFLKWVKAMLETVTDPHALEEFYTVKIEPFIEELMPPDRAECVALFSARERQLEP